MSDFSSAVSEDNRFSTSDVGLNTNLNETTISKDVFDRPKGTTYIFPTP